MGGVVVSIPVRFTVGQQQSNAFYVPGHGVVTGKKARVVGQKKKEEGREEGGREEEGRRKKRKPECWKEEDKSVAKNTSSVGKKIGGCMSVDQQINMSWKRTNDQRTK